MNQSTSKEHSTPDAKYSPQTSQTLDDAFRAMIEARKLCRFLSEEEDRLELALKTTMERYEEASEQVTRTREAVVRLVVEAMTDPIPSLEDWGFPVRPHARVEVESGSFVLLPGRDEPCPDTIDELVGALDLAIVELSLPDPAGPSGR